MIKTLIGIWLFKTGAQLMILGMDLVDELTHLKLLNILLEGIAEMVKE